MLTRRLHTIAALLLLLSAPRVEAQVIGLAVQQAGTAKGSCQTVNFSGVGLSSVSCANNICTVAISGSSSSTVTTAAPISGDGSAGTPVTIATQTANRIFAGPTSGLAAKPTFRTLVAADYPAASVPGSALASGAAVTNLGYTPAPVGVWMSVNAPGAPVVEDANFAPGFRTNTETGTFSTMNCSWLVAGTGGTAGVIMQVFDLTSGTQVCAPALAPCTASANVPVFANCSTAFTSGHTYVMRLKSTTDCDANPQNIFCNLTLIR